MIREHPAKSLKPVTKGQAVVPGAMVYHWSAARSRGIVLALCNQVASVMWSRLSFLDEAIAAMAEEISAKIDKQIIDDLNNQAKSKEPR